MLGLTGLILIPVGLFWTIKEIKRKKNDSQYRINRRAIILLTLPLTLFLTSIYISSLVRNFSRDFVISRADRLVQSIEWFKQKTGRYPVALSDLTPEFIAEIPSPFVMGIDEYDYKTQGATYNISFYQNVTMSFNFEVVTYDPTDDHKVEGESTDLYDTGRDHWKYYVYD